MLQLDIMEIREDMKTGFEVVEKYDGKDPEKLKKIISDVKKFVESCYSNVDNDYYSVENDLKDFKSEEGKKEALELLLKFSLAAEKHRAIFMIRFEDCKDFLQNMTSGSISLEMFRIAIKKAKKVVMTEGNKMVASLMDVKFELLKLLGIG